MEKNNEANMGGAFGRGNGNYSDLMAIQPHHLTSTRRPPPPHTLPQNKPHDRHVSKFTNTHGAIEAQHFSLLGLKQVYPQLMHCTS